MSVVEGRADNIARLAIQLWTERTSRADIGPLELPIVREAVTGAMMPAITLPTNGLRLLRLESTCLNEPLPHDRQKAVGFSIRFTSDGRHAGTSAGTESE